MSKKNFERKETKYLLTLEQYELIRQEIAPYMKEDQYGMYTISSVYFDNDQFEFIQHSMDKPKYKEKFRIRSYGVKDIKDPVFLEIKKKFKGIVYKRRISLTYAEMIKYFQKDFKNLQFDRVNQQIHQEIQWLFKREELKPKALISYDRIALKGLDDPELRVTFDFNIRYRADRLDFRWGTGGNPVAPEVGVIMEIKALGAYPVGLTHILSKLKIYPGSFSKYAETYKRYLLKKENVENVI